MELLPNIYRQKRFWKIMLLIAATCIFAFSLYYTQGLVNKLKKDEQERIKLWANAIQKKAALVKFTSDIISQTNIIVSQTADEERKKAELYASASKQLENPSGFSFALEVLKNNTSVPVILTDANGIILGYRNLSDSTREKDSVYKAEQLREMKLLHEPIIFEYLKNHRQYLYYKNSKLHDFTKDVYKKNNEILVRNIKAFVAEVEDNSASVPVILVDSASGLVRSFGKIGDQNMNTKYKIQDRINEMKLENDPIYVNLGEGTQIIFYENSYLLKQLKYYPWFQFVVIGLFLLIAYLLFSTFRKAEQNQVWVGMSKETAHQLGTPLSALYGWLQYFNANEANAYAVKEMNRDLERLNVIADRFSKIGSQPILQRENIILSVENILDYLRTRASKNVTFVLEKCSEEIFVNLSVPLFEWVIENIVKNAIDAMSGKGEITIIITENGSHVIIDFNDSGKGIKKSKFKTIFKPGFTTKQRGWGMGLSLAKRIIENYHSGKIFVKESGVRGTSFRLIMKKFA